MGKRKSDFNRVLLKISGEALMADREFGLDQVTVERVSLEIKAVYDFGVGVGILSVGSIFRVSLVPQMEWNGLQPIIWACLLRS